MKTMKEYIDIKRRTGYLKRGDQIDIELAMYLTDDRFAKEIYETWDDGAIQAKHPSDIIADHGTYATVYRNNRFKPFIFMGECLPGSIKNVNPAIGKKIYICSRYRADTEEELRKNIEVAIMVCSDISDVGDIPIAPHLYFPQFIDDDTADGREFGIRAGMEAMKECDSMIAIIRDEKISEGIPDHTSRSDTRQLRRMDTFQSSDTILSGRRLKSQQRLPEAAQPSGVTITIRPKAEKWSSPAAASTSARLPVRSIGTATSVLGIRTGTTSGAHFVNYLA